MSKGRNEKQYIKLLIIRDFLYSHTNENHYVTSLDIQKHLEKKGISADRKTIFADINRLEDDYRMGIVRGGRKGYRVASPQFEPNELRLLIDSVQSAKFITEEEATTITGKIKGLTDVYTRPTLERKAFVSERVQNMKESIVSHTDVIHEAINLDSKISFKYAHYKPSLSKNTKRYSRGGDPFIVSPFALYWNNGNYYLYAYLSDKKQMRFFRIDRTESIKLASEKREGHETDTDNGPAVIHHGGGSTELRKPLHTVVERRDGRCGTAVRHTSEIRHGHHRSESGIRRLPHTAL